MTSDLSQQFGDLSLNSGRNEQQHPSAACAVAGLDLAAASLRELIGQALPFCLTASQKQVGVLEQGQYGSLLAIGTQCRTIVNSTAQLADLSMTLLS